MARDLDPAPIRIAEMIGELLAASPCLPAGFGLDQFGANTRNLARKGHFREAFRNRDVRGWLKAENAPRMDSLALFALNQNVSMLRLLTAEIAVDEAVAGPGAHARCRVAGPAVEEALRGSSRRYSSARLEEIAKDVGYRSIAPWQNRYRELCSQVVSKRRSGLKLSPISPGKPVPRERVERALSDALNHMMVR